MIETIKRKIKDIRDKNNGVALILVVMGLSIMFLVGLAVASTAASEISVSDASARDVSAHYLAETGLNQALSMIRNIQQGDLNDLLAGPDSQCPSPCTSGAGSWGTIPAGGAHALSTHGNEFVIDNSAAGTGSNSSDTGPSGGKWSSVDTGNVLSHSLYGTPLFQPGTIGFDAADPSSIASGGDGRPAGYIPCGNASVSGSWNNCPGSGPAYPDLNWAGKREYFDKVTNTKYVVLLEVYDDDDPLSLQYDAWKYASSFYPKGFDGSDGTSSSRVYGGYPPASDPNNNTADPRCGLDGDNPDECPGDRAGRSFSNVNRDFNNRVAIRATGRILKNYNGRWNLLSESVVDAIVGFLPYPAIITGNCLEVSGSTNVSGAYGSIFSNANICISGNGSAVSRFAGAAGSICGGTIAPSQAVGQPELFIPNFKPLPNLAVTPYDDGPQAAPYLNPTLTLSAAETGIPVSFAVASDSSGQRLYAGDYWLKQTVRTNNINKTKPLNPIPALATGGYILLQPYGTSGSRRTCENGNSSCTGSENGILARLGIKEGDLNTLRDRVALSSGSTPPGNGDTFTPGNALILRLVIKPGVPFSNGTGTINLDVIDRTRIFVASISGGNPNTRRSTDTTQTDRPRTLGGYTTYEFYRIVPGCAGVIDTPGLGETLSSYNAGGPPSNSSNTGGYGDSTHGWQSPSGSAGTCGSVPSTGCSGGCNNCPVYTDPSCHDPYGGTWSFDERDEQLRGYTYFIDGNFTANGVGNTGSSLGAIRATLITTGYVSLRGNNSFQPVMKAQLAPIQPPFTSPTVQFLAGSDIDFGGNVADGVTFDGLAYAREQIAGTGSGTYNGQMVAADKASKDDKVVTDQLSGSYAVSFNRSSNVLGTLSVIAWRKMKF